MSKDAMKKTILYLTALTLGIMQLSFGVRTTTNPTIEWAGVSTITSAHLSAKTADDHMQHSVFIEVPETMEDESYLLCDTVPLSFDEQEKLQAACEEFDVPYALALGLIEVESDFRNILGDNGASTGYMQIQKRWHKDRMERLGVNDLSDPEGNFRVGLDYLSELYRKYGSWEMALTVYNRGHNPGYITRYAYRVLESYEKWQNVVDVGTGAEERM